MQTQSSQFGPRIYTILGDHGVGKSAFVYRLVNGRFNGKYIQDLTVKTVKIGDDVYQIGVGSNYIGKYQPCSKYILMFDLTDINTLHYVLAISQTLGNFPKVFLGNKSDLINRLPTYQIQALLTGHEFHEISVLNGNGI